MGLSTGELRGSHVEWFYKSLSQVPAARLLSSPSEFRAAVLGETVLLTDEVMSGHTYARMLSDGRLLNNDFPQLHATAFIPRVSLTQLRAWAEVSLRALC